jgi:hypothetical protein
VSAIDCSTVLVRKRLMVAPSRCAPFGTFGHQTGEI